MNVNSVYADSNYDRCSGTNRPNPVANPINLTTNYDNCYYLPSYELNPLDPRLNVESFYHHQL